MAWRWPGDRSFSEPTVVRFLTHICVTRPQWEKVSLIQNGNQPEIMGFYFHHLSLITRQLLRGPCFVFAWIMIKLHPRMILLNMGDVYGVINVPTANTMRYLCQPVVWCISQKALGYDGRSKMAAILQTTVSNVFSWKQRLTVWLKFRWKFFMEIKTIICLKALNF